MIILNSHSSRTAAPLFLLPRIQRLCDWPWTPENQLSRGNLKVECCWLPEDSSGQQPAGEIGEGIQVPELLEEFL